MNIPIEKAFSCVLPLSPFVSQTLSFSVLLFFLIPPFFAGFRLGQEHTGDESELESRRVCVTYNYFPRQVRLTCTELANRSVIADERSEVLFSPLQREPA